VAACGGDLVGTWTASTACVTNGTQTVTMAGCSIVATVTPQITGTITFTSTGTYTASLTSTATTTVTVPASCLGVDAGAALGSTTLSCAELQTEFGGSATVESASCSNGAAGGCTCILTPTMPSVAMTAGTYTTRGTVATTVDATGTSSTSYCVSGSYLHILSSSDAGTGMMGMNPSTDLVFVN